MHLALSQFSQILIRSRLISFHMLHTTPQTAGIVLHTTISPCMPRFHLTSLQMHSGSTLHQYFRLFISAAVPRRRHFSQLLGLASLHAVPLALSTLATTVHRTLDTRSQHSATAMAPLSTNGTCSHRFVPPTTAGLYSSLSDHCTAATTSCVASHANTFSTSTNLCHSRARTPSTTSAAGI